MQAQASYGGEQRTLEKQTHSYWCLLGSLIDMIQRT